MSNTASTYSKMAKWLKWASLFILLIPLTLFILSIVTYFDKMEVDVYNKTARIMYIALLVLSVIWTILNIILFFTAGTVKNKTSPTMIRVGLLISFVLVFAPEIISLLLYYGVITGKEKAIELISLFMPLVIAIGYLVGHSCAKNAQRKTA
ncbi:MAG: hypothetical protein ACOQNV_01480 [Mycoplasmoidaceae bacterium]